MLIISRMKSLVSPSFSTFSPYISISGHRTFFSTVPMSVLPKPIFLQAPHSFNFNGPSISLPRKGRFLIQNRAEHMGVSRSHSPGEIHVIVGPMFAGKTTTLLERIQSESSNGRVVTVIKSNKDTRYGLDSIVTHDGMELPCWALLNLSSFKQKFGQDAYEKLDVIGIDEAQFFDDLYDFCREAADIDGKTVIVAGLDGDYLRKRFGSVLDVIPLADSVTKLNAKCEICGHRAFFTLRKTEETQTELIGGADVYMPVCRQHYVSGQVAIETARNVVEESQKIIRCGSPA